MRRCPLVIALLLLAAVGCKTVPAEEYAVGATRQKYSFDEVKKRVPRLRPGMSKYEVAVLLGSPAEMQPSTWIYLPDKQKVLLPQRLLAVEFDGMTYVSHEFRPIVFGQTTE